MSRVKDDYFEWLMEIVRPVRNGKSWLILMKVLGQTDFEVLIPNDINRCIDGCGLREEFRLSSHHSSYAGIMGRPCSVLELLLSLARKMDFELSDPYYTSVDRTGRFFWELLRNLGLDGFDDDAYSRKPGAGSEVKRILRVFMSRDYDECGHGGAFPLTCSRRDQRYVELWRQLSEYLEERYPISSGGGAEL